MGNQSSSPVYLVALSNIFRGNNDVFVDSYVKKEMPFLAKYGGTLVQISELPSSFSAPNVAAAIVFTNEKAYNTFTSSEYYEQMSKDIDRMIKNATWIMI